MNTPDYIPDWQPVGTDTANVLTCPRQGID